MNRNGVPAASLATEQGAGGSGKQIVMGMQERGGKVVTKHVPSTDRKTLQGHIKATVHKGSNVYS